MASQFLWQNFFFGDEEKIVMFKIKNLRADPVTKDDGVSKHITLKKGPSVVCCAVVNGSGATDFCARVLDRDDAPAKNFIVNLAKAPR